MKLVQVRDTPENEGREQKSSDWLHENVEGEIKDRK